jgi:RNA polymerase-associated protein
MDSGVPEKADRARNILRSGVLSAVDVFAIKPYFLSTEFSLVDCTIAPVLWRLPKYGIDMPATDVKPLMRYMDRVFSRDMFQESLTETDKSIRP